MADDDSTSSSDSPSTDSIESPPNPGVDEVQAAFVGAMRSKSIDVDDDAVTINEQGTGLYHFAVRMSRRNTPLPKIPDDTSDLAPGSVEGAATLLQGALQILGDRVRVTMRLVSVETSEILEASNGDADGANESGIGDAVGTALDGMPSLSSDYTCG